MKYRIIYLLLIASFALSERIVAGETVNADLGSVNYSNGLSLIDVAYGTWGSTYVSTYAAVQCRTGATSGTCGFYFNVSDGYSFNGSRPDLYITVEYFDNGTDWLILQYDSIADGPAKEPSSPTPYIFHRKNTNTWRTFTWHVMDAYFGNRAFLNADFSIMGGGTTSINRVWVHEGSKAILDLGQQTVSNDLRLVDTVGGSSAASVGGVECRQSSSSMYFDVADGFCYGTSRDKLHLTIHYWDGGGGSITLQYNTRTGGLYKSAAILNKQNSNKWKVQTWRLTDTSFTNGQSGGADFRLLFSKNTFVDLIYVRVYESSSRRRVMGPRQNSSEEPVVLDAKPFYDLMTDHAGWARARSEMGAFSYYNYMLDNHWNGTGTAQGEDPQLGLWLQRLRNWGKPLLIDVGVLQLLTGVPSQPIYNHGVASRMIDRVHDLGGLVTDIIMDEPFVQAHRFSLGDRFWAAKEIADYMGLVRSDYPLLKIGLFEHYNYFSMNEIEDRIRLLEEACAAKSVETIDYFVLDADWTSPSAWDNFDRFSDWCVQRALPWGMNYSASAHFGNPGATDIDWYNDIMYQGSRVRSSGAIPDMYMVKSWSVLPNQTNPDSAQWTFTMSVADFFEAYGH